jgi:hypothetical protein
MGLELGAACVIRREDVAAYQKQVGSTKSVQDQVEPRNIYTAQACSDGVVPELLGFADYPQGTGCSK